MKTSIAAPVAAIAPRTTKDDPTRCRVADALWAELAPPLRVDKPRKQPGAPRKEDRRIFAGLLWLARSGAQWRTLPRACGPTSTAHERCQAWVAYGCLARAWARRLAVYDDAAGRDWTWRPADGCLVQAPRGKKGGPARRKTPGASPRTGARPLRGAPRPSAIG